MTQLEIYQKQYGQELKKVLTNPALQAGLQLLNLRKIEQICALTDEDIKEHADQILGGIRAHFQHESDLMNLHRMKEFKFAEEPPADYISPEAEAELQDVVKKHQKRK